MAGKIEVGGVVRMCHNFKISIKFDVIVCVCGCVPFNYSDWNRRMWHERISHEPYLFSHDSFMHSSCTSSSSKISIKLPQFAFEDMFIRYTK